MEIFILILDMNAVLALPKMFLLSHFGCKHIKSGFPLEVIYILQPKIRVKFSFAIKNFNTVAASCAQIASAVDI